MEQILEKLQKIVSYLSEEEKKELELTLNEIFTEECFSKSPKIRLKTGWAKGNETDEGDNVSIYLRVEH